MSNQKEKEGANAGYAADSLVFRSDRPWPNARFRAAAIVGHATSTSVRLWLRTAQPGEYVLVLYDPGETIKSSQARRSLRTALGVVPLSLDEIRDALAIHRVVDFTIEDYSADTIRVLDLEGLDQDTSYGYLLYSPASQRVMLGHNRLRRFRTPPAEDEKRPFRFALLSCHMPYQTNGLFRKQTEVAGVEMWDYLNMTLDRHEREVDLVIAGGDQYYTDGVPTLDIWKLLDRVMRKEDGKLLPEEAAMWSWYRDIARGYWGFAGLQRVFERFPTYMTWDDHEIGDGWGSHYLAPDGPEDGLQAVLPSLDERGLSRDDGIELLDRMFRAAGGVYAEYQHSHNPPTPDGVWDYAFRRGGTNFYMLDGRGCRDIDRKSYRILGKEQFDRFSEWAKGLDPEAEPFLFVVSAVPVLHTRTALVRADDNLLIGQAGLGDDLRDSWEHPLHDEERQALMRVLFDAAARGMCVAILSGDVHVSAAFRIGDGEGRHIWQLTSSTITYQLSRAASWILRQGAAESGVTEDGYSFERYALYTGSSYAMVSVDPQSREARFRLYGAQELESPPDTPGPQAEPVPHALANIHLV